MTKHKMENKTMDEQKKTTLIVVTQIKRKVVKGGIK